MKSKTQKVAKVVLVVLAVVLMPRLTEAAQITDRSVTLSNSAPSASASYLFEFEPGTTGNVGSIRFQICDSPVEAVPCVAPSSADASGASGLTLGGEIGSTTGFAIGGGTPPAPTATTVWITDGSPESLTQGVASTVLLSSIVNPSVNREFYARITTFTNANGTGQIDYGAVALRTNSQITVSGTMPESLVFCVGTTWTTDCSDIAGTTVNLGTFSPTATSTGTSVMAASTNAGSGYAITINGTTMQSGINSIAAMGTQTLNSTGCAPSCTSATGTSQFGANVRDNTAPNVGANVSGSGTATGFGGYNTIDSFRFFTGDTVASVGGQTNSNLFTTSYIVNVGGSQAAGLYTATFTYICTATF